VSKEAKPAECRIRVTEGSRMRAQQINTFSMEIIAPNRTEPLKVELLESEQYTIISPNPIVIEGLDEGPRAGVFILRPSKVGAITLNFRVGDHVRTLYADVQTENPYVFGEPIKDERLFFGRTTELSETYHGIIKRNKQNFLVTGPRRMGKTSFLYQLQARLQYPFVPLMLTPEEMGHEHYQMFRFILLKLREVAQESLGEEPPPLSWELKTATHQMPLDLFNFYFVSDLKKHLAWLASLNDEARVILLLDEATFLLTSPVAEATGHDSRQQFLRHLLQSHDRIACVLAGTPQILKMTSITSPLYNIFRGVKLRGFSREETEKLIREPAQQARVRFEDEAVTRIVDYGGGSPYYTQALCSLAWEQMDETINKLIEPEEAAIITTTHVQAAIEGILDTVSYGLQSLWEALEPDEREMLGNLAASGSIEVTSQNRDVVSRLLDMSLVTVNEATQFASIKAKLDEEWLRQQGV
jgi:hypothetical protein